MPGSGATTDCPPLWVPGLMMSDLSAIENSELLTNMFVISGEHIYSDVAQKKLGFVHTR